MLNIRCCSILFATLFLAACGPKSMGMTTDEFDKAVEQLYGKSTQEVTKVLGKPKIYQTAGSTSCFIYEGVKDSATGMLSTSSLICFLNNRLKEQQPGHSFGE